MSTNPKDMKNILDAEPLVSARLSASAISPGKGGHLRDRGAEQIGLVFRMPDGSVGALTQFGRVTWELEHLATPQPAPAPELELRRAVRSITGLLANRERAEHVSTDPDAQALESAITRLHRENSAAIDSLRELRGLLDGTIIADGAQQAIARADAVLAGLKQVECCRCGRWKYPQQLSPLQCMYMARKPDGTSVKCVSPICIDCVSRVRPEQLLLPADRARSHPGDAHA